MLVRPAALEDLKALSEMCASVHRESAYRFLPFDHEKVREEILTYIEHPATHCGLVAEADGECIAMLGGYLGEYFFCREKIACDVVFFVAPAYRATFAAPLLIRAFRKWATERGAAELCLSVSTQVNAERTGKFYEAMGFVPVGGNFKLRLTR